MIPWHRQQLEALAIAYETPWDLTDAIRAAIDEIDNAPDTSSLQSRIEDLESELRTATDDLAEANVELAQVSAERDEANAELEALKEQLKALEGEP